jgi:hypothetical protein
MSVSGPRFASGSSHHAGRGPTPQTVAMLAAIEAGETRRAVAARLGMSLDAVDQAIERWRYSRPVRPTQMRTCLCCRHAFESDGMRLCKTCKERDEFGGLGAVQI